MLTRGGQLGLTDTLLLRYRAEEVGLNTVIPSLIREMFIQGG